MLLEKNLADAIVTLAEEAAERLKKVRKYAAAVEMLAGAGIEVKANKYALMYRQRFEIKREQLPLIRKLFGRLRAGYRSLGSIRDGVQMIDVVIHLHDKEWEGISFEYEVPFRPGGKCHIEKVDSSYNTLVCKA